MKSKKSLSMRLTEGIFVGIGIAVGYTLVNYTLTYSTIYINTSFMGQ